MQIDSQKIIIISLFNDIARNGIGLSDHEIPILYKGEINEQPIFRLSLFEFLPALRRKE